MGRMVALIASLAVEWARRAGCDTIAHGCTGKGNDQVRIDGTIAALDPELKVLTDWVHGKKEDPSRSEPGSDL